MPVCRYKKEFWTTERCEEFEKFWRGFKKSIIQIYTGQGPKSIKKCMELYTAVYNHCTKIESNSNVSLKYGQERYTQCYKLYTSLKGFFIEYLTNMVQRGMELKGENFLMFYICQWEKFKINSKLLHHICGYLIQNWVLTEKKERVNDVYEIYRLALISWKNCLFSYLHKKLTNTILTLIYKGRNGESLNTKLISLVVNCYVQLDNLDKDENDKNQDIYKNFFEKQFIEATEAFYTRETKRLLCPNYSLIEYMKRIDQRLSEESNRAVELRLHLNTHDTLIETCERIFIKNQLDIFYLEFKNLLKTDNKIQLTRIFGLISKEPEALKELATILEIHIIDDGFEAIKKFQVYALVDYPKAYTDTIIKIYKKYKLLMQDCFDDYNRFVGALNKACVRLVNDDSVTKTIEGCKNKSPELIAKYCDSVLSKNGKNQEEADEFDDKLDHLVTLCRYLDNRDVFQDFYLKKLAKRLISHLSVSYDAEALMISKFKQTFGPEFISKIEEMFNDFEISLDLNKRFREFDENSEDPLDIDFGMQVLYNKSWPFQQSKNFFLPLELKISEIKFNKWYNLSHKDRKLHLLHDLSTGELYTDCFEDHYTLQASTYQIAVLLQYNKSTYFTLQELHKSTRIEMNFLIQVIQTLLNAKLLETSDDSETLLRPSSKIKLVEKFKNEKSRVDINVPLEIVLRMEEERMHKNIKEDRNHVIQAVIVRIMKKRKTIDHKQLLTEVLNQLSSKFKPKVSVIKTNIDLLIDKLYLERLEGHSDIYSYIE